MRLCTHPDGCPRELYAKGWCYNHYERMRKYGVLGPAVGKYYGERDCAQCGEQFIKQSSSHSRCPDCMVRRVCVSCRVPMKSDRSNLRCPKCQRIEVGRECRDCGKSIAERNVTGLCLSCIKFLPPKRIVNRDGYIKLSGVRDYPRDGRGYREIWEHHYVYWKATGRKIDTAIGESLHHLNGDRADNRIENLELWSSSQPAGQRVSDKVAHSEYILGLYAPEKLRGKTH